MIHFQLKCAVPVVESRENAGFYRQVFPGDKEMHYWDGHLILALLAKNNVWEDLNCTRSHWGEVKVLAHMIDDGCIIEGVNQWQLSEDWEHPVKCDTSWIEHRLGGNPCVDFEYRGIQAQYISPTLVAFNTVCIPIQLGMDALLTVKWLRNRGFKPHGPTHPLGITGTIA